MVTNISRLFISWDSSIRTAAQCIDSHPEEVALVVDEEHHLLGVITDDDLRRVALNQLEFDSDISGLLALKTTKHPNAPVGAEISHLIALMKQHNVRHVPIVNAQGQVIDLVTIDDIVFRNRAEPPVIETGEGVVQLLNQLSHVGIRNIAIIENAITDRFKAHYHENDTLGLHIQYVPKEQPFFLSHGKGKTLLVIDLRAVVEINLQSMFAFHQRLGADLTIAVRRINFNTSDVVITSIDGVVSGINKQVKTDYFTNTGIYMLETNMLKDLPAGIDWTDTDAVINQSIQSGKKVASFVVNS